MGSGQWMMGGRRRRQAPAPAVARTRPSLVWISRQSTCVTAISKNSLGRCVRNLEEVLEWLRRSGLYESVQSIDDFRLRHDRESRDALWRSQLEVLRDADILVGVHGAGLTNAIFLDAQAKPVLVEVLAASFAAKGFGLIKFGFLPALGVRHVRVVTREADTGCVSRAKGVAERLSTARGAAEARGGRLCYSGVPQHAR